MESGIRNRGVSRFVASIALTMVAGSVGVVMAADAPSVDLSEKQSASLKIAPVQTYVFPVEKEAVGSVDFNEDLAVQVFPSFPGKIIAATAQLGDYVQKGKPLYTIDSPDLINAESNLIAAAAALDLTKAALARAKILYENQGMAQKDYEQAVSDEQTAAGALNAARDAVRVFGKSTAAIDRIISSRKIDPALVVVSPVSGRITARNAQPGLLVQPGNPPAPYAVADVSTKWLLANVPESDIGIYHEGQVVKVSVTAYPGKVFEGRVERISATVDPNSHRLTLRSDIRDPKDELRPNMFASFEITVGEPVKSPGIPMPGVVRESDGTMSAWVTVDGRHFTQRVITIGLQKNGYDQVLTGLKAGENVVTDGAIFLSNMLTASPSD